MKKVILFFIAFSSITASKTFCQNLFYDAKKLASWTKDAGKDASHNTSYEITPSLIVKDTNLQKRIYDSIATILSYYFPININDIGNSSRVTSAIQLNPFFANYSVVGVARAGGGSAQLLDLSSSLSSLGGISIPNDILLGVTDFIVKRTKQELSIAFFEKFKKMLEDPKYIDLQTVFPQTHKNLLAIGDEIYQYEAYIQGLRESFKKDIEALDKNLPTIIDNHPTFWAKHKEWKASLQSSFYIAEALGDKVHPGDILNDYPTDYLDALNTNWKGALQTLQLFSASLRDTAQNKDSAYWVSPKQIKELVKDKITFKIYLGLVYQTVIKDYPDGINFNSKGSTTNTSLISILKNVANNYSTSYTSYANYITHVSEKTNKLTTLIRNNTKAANDSIAFQQYYDYYNATLNLMQQCTEISSLPYIKEIVPHLADTLKPYFEIAHTTADLVMDIKKKSYSSAITDAVRIYELVKAKPASEPQARRIIINSTTLNDSLQNDILKSTITSSSKSLFKYGSFMAAMATAKSSAEVEKAIEAIALPVGSARIKRESPFNVSLNAYCGLFVGNEVIKGIDTDNPFAKFNSSGLTAPIGISISKGMKGFLPFSKSGTHKNNWSHSLFISIIDLGAVAAYRFKDDSTAQVPTVQLKDIFSPGIFWSIGVPKYPLSVNLGVQVGPNLRTVTSKLNDYSSSTYVRYSLSVCVDIPVLNLYTRSR